MQLPDGSALRLTTAKYYTPGHQVIHEHGVAPTIVATRETLTPAGASGSSAGNQTRVGRPDPEPGTSASEEVHEAGTSSSNAGRRSTVKVFFWAIWAFAGEGEAARRPREAAVAAALARRARREEAKGVDEVVVVDVDVVVGEAPATSGDAAAALALEETKTATVALPGTACAGAAALRLLRRAVVFIEKRARELVRW